MFLNDLNDNSFAALAILVCSSLIFFAGHADASTSQGAWSTRIDSGVAWQNRNDVQIPGDTGTRFSLADLDSSANTGFYRLELFYKLLPKHSIRFLYAPFRLESSGTFDKNVFFVDREFESGKPVKATYQFNSYRASYRYTFHEAAKWLWHIGFSAKIRDAEIKLSQDGKSAIDSNIGFVPLLYLYGEYKLSPHWNFVVDFDGLVGPQGRAFDVAIMAHRYLSRTWYLGGGYRTLEGGADNDTVYNFAWINYLFVSAGYRF